MFKNEYIIRAMKSKTQKIILSKGIFGPIVLLLMTFYIFLYWHEPQLDFVHMYTAGSIWKTSSGNWYYEYEIVEQKDGFIIQTPLRYDQYASNLGYDSKYPLPLFTYFPAFIPLFSIFSALPLFFASKLFIVLSTFCLFITVKKAIEEEWPDHFILLGFCIAVLILCYSVPVCWSIGSGQITPYLFAGTWLSLYLQQKQRPLGAGLLLAVVTWIKFFPGIIVLYWLFVNDYKALLSFAAGMIALFLIALFLFDLSVLNDYVALLRVFSTGAVLALINQSVEAFLMRFYYSINFMREIANTQVSYLAKMIVLFIKSLLLFSWFYFTVMEHRISLQLLQKPTKRVSAASGYYAMGIMILLMPIAWVHYFIFLIPLCIWIAKPIGNQIIISPLFWIVFFLALLFVFLPSGTAAYIAGTIIRRWGEPISRPVTNIVFTTPLLGSIAILMLAHVKLHYMDKERGLLRD
jgi:hypothetical protein